MLFNTDQIDAILFDFDGVIVDSMEDNFNAWKKALSKHSIDIDKTDYYKIEGVKAIQVAESYLKKNGQDTELATLIAKDKDEIFRESSTLKIYPGVEELISKLSDSFKLGIVTGSSRIRFSKMVEGIPFFNKFNVVVTANDIKKGKPDPSPYLSAASKLQIKPERCLVIENAPLGIASAKNAAMKCVAVESTLSSNYLEQADVIYNSISDLYNEALK